jgi:uncharacterized protein YdaU (DUF1376 family)
MSAPPYMRFWPADYLGDTRHLTTQEHGAYLLLILAYWQNEGPLADDDKRMARIVGMTPREWTKAKKTIAEFFQIAAGQWRHKRIEAELAHVRTKSAKASAAVKTRYERPTDVATNVERSNYERTTDALPVQSSEFRVRNTQNLGSEREPLTGGSLSPDTTSGRKPRETKPDRPKVVWPKLGEEPA